MNYNFSLAKRSLDRHSKPLKQRNKRERGKKLHEMMIDEEFILLLFFKLQESPKLFKSEWDFK